jgi:ABC-type transport system involved in multi-copper enzyme maturation permease subunit
MTALIRSEFRKVFSTKLLLILSISALGFMLLQIFLSVLVTPPGFEDTNRLMDPAYIKIVIASAGSASVFLLILGIVAMSGEYRNQTITSTFLATPVRWRVMAAKMTTFAILALALAFILWLIAAFTTMLLLGTQDSAPFEWSAAFEILGGTLIGLVLYAILGVAIGSLITSQVAAIIIALVFSFVIEPLLTVFFLTVGKWLPGNALNAILQSGGGGPESNPADFVSVPVGIAVLVGYTVVFAIAAAFITNKRDIT